MTAHTTLPGLDACALRQVRLLSRTLLLLTLVTALVMPFRIEAPATAAAPPSEIWVSPAGSDMTGTGERDAPFRSIREAMTRAVAGDTIWVLPGEYGLTHGESLPITVTSGVSVRGWGPGRPRIIAGTAAPVFLLNGCNGQTLIEAMEIDGGHVLTTAARNGAIVVNRTADTGGPTIRDCWIHRYRTSTGSTAGHGPASP